MKIIRIPIYMPYLYIRSLNINQNPDGNNSNAILGAFCAHEVSKHSPLPSTPVTTTVNRPARRFREGNARYVFLLGLLVRKSRLRTSFPMESFRYALSTRRRFAVSTPVMTTSR